MKEKWGTEGDSQSDNQEILSQSDNNLGPDMMGGGAMSDVMNVRCALTVAGLITFIAAMLEEKVLRVTRSVCFFEVISSKTQGLLF